MRKIFSLFALVLLTMSAWGADTYVKVNSLDQLVDGQKYILVNEEYSRAMGDITGTSTNFGSTVDITIDNGVIDIEGTDVVELTISEGSPDVYGNPSWYFDINGGSHFLIWTSGNSLNTVTAVGAIGSQWLADLTDDGVILKNKADNTRILQYNSGAPRFACYTSPQKPAVLYKQGAPEDEGINTLSKANALDDDASFDFNGNVVVTYQNGDYLFVRDDSGYGLIYGAVGSELANGQVLNPGWNAIKASVDGWVRFTNADGISASGETNAELGAPQVVTSLDESMLNAYVCFENVTVSLFTRSIKLEDGTSIPMFNMFNQNMPASGFPGMSDRHHNAYGIIGMQSGVLKFIPVDFEEYVEPAILRGDVNNDKMVDIDDVTALISYVLSGNADGINIDNAECNQVDGIDIDDVTALNNYLLNGSW